MKLLVFYNSTIFFKLLYQLLLGPPTAKKMYCPNLKISLWTHSKADNLHTYLPYMFIPTSTSIIKASRTPVSLPLSPVDLEL